MKTSRNFNFSNIWILPILILFCIPSVFINLNNWHDWGDDFAQYLVQAKMMIGQIKFPSIECYSGYSPRFKGPFFSFLLIPAILSGHDCILAGKLIVSIFLVIGACFIYLFYNTRFSTPVSLLFTIYLVYQYHTLLLKGEILPDLVLLAFIAGVCFCYHKYGFTWLVALLAGSASGIKSIAIIVPIALCIHLFLSRKKNLSKPALSSLLLMIILSLLPTLLEFIFAGNSAIAWYSRTFNSNTIASNYNAYLAAFRTIFEHELPLWLNASLHYALMISFIAGVIIENHKSLKLPAIIMILYIIVLLLYPYSGDGIRLLYPLVPFILYYSLVCIHAIEQRISNEYSLVLSMLVGILLIYGNFNNLKTGSGMKVELGATSPTAFELYDFIVKNDVNHEVVRFDKPWALTYFTGKLTIPLNSECQANWQVIRKTMLFEKKPVGKLIFENPGFSVYSQN